MEDSYVIFHPFLSFFLPSFLLIFSCQEDRISPQILATYATTAAALLGNDKKRNNKNKKGNSSLVTG